MIVHFDIDAFYSSVAQRDDPTLRGKPVAVAGESRRAVILTASYEARVFGVRSAIPLYRALELCKDLIVVPPDFTSYHKASRAAFAIFAQGAEAFEELSLDEAYVALPTCEIDEAIAYAREVRAEVRTVLGLTVSAGVSTQKLLAKIASDDAKPDGLRAVDPGTEAAYLRDLSVGRLWGVGPKTQERLRLAGIVRVGDLAELDDAPLFGLFGKQGREIREMARGNDVRSVRSDRKTRSISSETTFPVDLRSIEALQAHLDELSEDVASRLREHGFRAQTIGVKVKRANFEVHGRQMTLDQATDLPATIRSAALSCLKRCDVQGEAIRLLGIRACSLVHGAGVQLSLLPDGLPSRAENRARLP
ncbi:MAG TPA: DNA polymerase IV [Candidatus Baltobacteraceae bacterium]|jgi:DNA polymerase-4|nr:DNA polymerase IV [Candidatus Baltobacteraceae bacterium]